MVELKYNCNTGNRLFQYCVARIIAEHHGLKLKADGIKWFPNTFEKVDGLSYEENPVTLKGHEIDLESILNKKCKNKIVLNGLFIRWKYLENFEEKIKKWTYVDMNNFNPLPEDEVAVHIRGKDYLRVSHKNDHFKYVKPEMYKNILPLYRKVHIVTDDRQHPVIPFLIKEYGAKITGYNSFDDFRFLMSASNIVFTFSTFAWWAAYLSNAKTIHTFKIGDHFEILNTKQDRYVWHDCTNEMIV